MKQICLGLSAPRSLVFIDRCISSKSRFCFVFFPFSRWPIFWPALRLCSFLSIGISWREWTYGRRLLWRKTSLFPLIYCHLKVKCVYFYIFPWMMEGGKWCKTVALCVNGIHTVQMKESKTNIQTHSTQREREREKMNEKSRSLCRQTKCSRKT